MKVFNPATDELLAELQEDSAEQITEKFELLQKAAQAWSAFGLEDRIAILQKFSSLLEEKAEESARLLSKEVGKPLQQAVNEIRGARTRINWLTAHASKYLSPEEMFADDNMHELIHYEPLGVICNISAWNYPYLVGVNVFVPALIAGNAVLYKPSEFASLTGKHIAALLYEAGVPENVFQTVIGGKDAGEILTSLPFNGFYFTGSWATGKIIYEKVAKHMVPCQLELGGKDPVYVADDVKDVKSAAAGIADGAFYNNGQSCCSVERIYVHEKIYDEFIDEFVKEVQSYIMGAPDAENVYIGPLTRKAQIEVLKDQISDAVEKGAVVALGGKAAEGKGNYFLPTVLLKVTNDMKVMQEESFGPIIGIMKVSNDLQAAALMKDTKYGLTCAVYSADEKRATTILESADSGTGYWNCCDRVSAALPWSGRKQSGIGATLSHAGLRAFTRPKALHLRKA